MSLPLRILMTLAVGAAASCVLVGNGPVRVDGGPDDGAGGGSSISSIHTPADGCRVGFTPCGNVCADLSSDFRHCGRCNNDCSKPGSSQPCGAGTCGTACQAGLLSCQGTACSPPFDAYLSCGSCGNRCTDTEACVRLDAGYECIEGNGSSSHCNGPTIVPPGSATSVGLVFRSSSLSTAPVSCLGDKYVPARWVRFTAGPNQGGVSLHRVKAGSSSWALELSEDCATNLLGCSVSTTNGMPSISTTSLKAGRTYLLVVARPDAGGVFAQEAEAVELRLSP